MKQWSRKIGWGCVVGLLCLGMAAGCYTPEEYRAKTVALGDPRQEQADKMWIALMKVAKEEAWELELERREDLILTTVPLQVDQDLRKRIRFLIIKTPFAVGLNVTVKFEHSAEDAAIGWKEVRSPELSVKSKAEEQQLAQRVYAYWEADQ